MIRAIIFDMDGLLIDSEPLWKEAEIQIFGALGVPLTLEMTDQTTGLRTDEVVRYWYSRHPWQGADNTAVAQQIDAAVTELIIKRGEPKEGVAEVIKACKSTDLPLAIASSSPLAMINAVVKKLGIEEDIRVIHSAHDEEYGKPHPSVYLSTAASLGVQPDECLAFEDSANGVLAAKAAKMKCIAMPDPESRNDKRYGIADIVLHSLHDFSLEMLKDW